MKLETVFDPRVIGEKSYKQFYPELQRIEEFKNVPNKLLKVIWFYSCPSSPLVEEGLGNSERIHKALELADSERRMSKSEWARLQNLELSDEFIRASNRMSRVSYEVRLMGNEIINNFLRNFSAISKINYDSFTDGKGGIDYDKYAKTASTITSTLATLIEKAEEGFALARETNVIEEESLISRFHESRK